MIKNCFMSTGGHWTHWGLEGKMAKSHNKMAKDTSGSDVSLCELGLFCVQDNQRHLGWGWGGEEVKVESETCDYVWLEVFILTTSHHCWIHLDLDQLQLVSTHRLDS